MADTILIDMWGWLTLNDAGERRHQNVAVFIDQFHLIQIDELRFSQAQALRLKYLDKPQISFTDLTSIAVMQEFDIHRVLTEDAHFAYVGLGFECVPTWA